jgi:hypothetical protein
MSKLALPYNLKGSWTAWSENEVSEYLTCISYVRTVRRADGSVWNADNDAVFGEVSSILPNLSKDVIDPDKPKEKK